MEIDLPSLCNGRSWFLENDEISIGVEKATGWIRSTASRKAGVGIFQIGRRNCPGGYLGDLRV